MTTPCDNQVQPEDACPNCNERCADNLLWIDDEQVRCLTCGTVYTPPRE